MLQVRYLLFLLHDNELEQIKWLWAKTHLRRNSITCVLLPEQSTARCLFFVLSRINLPMASVKVQGNQSPIFGSSNSLSLPSASLVSLAHSFANVSHCSGSDWSNSAVCHSVGMSPRMVSLTKILFPFYLWSLFTTAFFFIFRSRVKIKSDLPLLHISAFTQFVLHVNGIESLFWPVCKLKWQRS